MAPSDPTRVTGLGLTIPPGTRLNGIFEIERQIGAGGMGMVYRAHNVETGDKVAIKIVRAEMADNEQVLALFRKEAAVLHRLLHDAIVRYYLFTSDPQIGRPYLATEFVDGTSLSDMGAIARDDVLALAERLAGGLQAAHELAVFHRDISPDNVILPERDVRRAKIIDFGIARSATLGGGTVIGDSIAGKFDYMSPEQLGLYGGQVDARSDIYSLGIVLAEAVLGESLKMGGTQLEVVEKRRKVPDLSRIEPKLRNLIAQMMQPRPEDRIGTMADVAAAAHKLRTGVASSGGGGSPLRLVAGLAAVAVIAGGGTYWFLTRDESPPETPPAPVLVRQDDTAADPPRLVAADDTTPATPPPLVRAEDTEAADTPTDIATDRTDTDAATPPPSTESETTADTGTDAASPDLATGETENADAPDESTGEPATDTSGDLATAPDTAADGTDTDDVAVADDAAPTDEPADTETQTSAVTETTTMADASTPPPSAVERERLGALGEAQLGDWLQGLAEPTTPQDSPPPQADETATSDTATSDTSTGDTATGENAADDAAPFDTARLDDTATGTLPDDTLATDPPDETAAPPADDAADAIEDRPADDAPPPPAAGTDAGDDTAPLSDSAASTTPADGGDDASRSDTEIVTPAVPPADDLGTAATTVLGDETAPPDRDTDDEGSATASLGVQPTDAPDTGPQDPLLAFLQGTDLGPCTYLQLVAHGPQSADIVAYGDDIPPFVAFDSDFEATLGFPADINLRPVAEPQCPAIDLARTLVAPGEDRLKLKMNADTIKPGGLLSGAISGIGRRQLHLYLVAGDGHLYGLADMLDRLGDDATFGFNMAGSSSGAPQHLLIAVAGDHLPNVASRPSGNMASDLAGLTEVLRNDPDAEAAIGYFKYGE